MIYQQYFQAYYILGLETFYLSQYQGYFNITRNVHYLIRHLHFKYYM